MGFPTKIQVTSATSDTTAPQLMSFSFAPTSVDVSNQAQVINFTGRATDDISGVNYFLVQLNGKSSLARIGLMVHNTAGIINPGHFLHVTFEITNQSNVPIVLRPGMKIAQITFSMLSSPPSKTYGDTGRFASDNWRHFVAEKKHHGAKKKKAR